MADSSDGAPVGGTAVGGTAAGGTAVLLTGDEELNSPRGFKDSGIEVTRGSHHQREAARGSL